MDTILPYPIIESPKRILYGLARHVFISSCRMGHLGGYLQKGIQRSSQRKLSKSNLNF